MTFASFLLLLVLHSVLENSAASPPTFEHRDPATGRPLQCDTCPPGTYMRSRCSALRSSDCAPCPDGSFTALWNYIRKCLRCGVCGRNEVVKKECSAESDCQCECKEGYFYKEEYGMCVRHSECPSGHGVLTPGTPTKDTVCGICPSGTFSDISSAHQNCTQHKTCSDAGLQLVLRGSTWHDTVCGNCGELQDGTEYLKQVIPAFFIHHKMNIKRLGRVVNRLQSEHRGTSELSFSEIISQISCWVSTATAEQIKQLPDILTKTGAIIHSEKLQKKLTQIDTYLADSCTPGA